jgi:ribosomal protein S16
MVYINGKYILSSNGGKINIDLLEVNGLKKENILNIVAIDSEENRSGKQILFLAI